MLTPEDVSTIEKRVERIVVKHTQPLHSEIDTLARVTARGFARIEERMFSFEQRFDRIEDHLNLVYE
jgi:hypothetical protein